MKIFPIQEWKNFLGTQIPFYGICVSVALVLIAVLVYWQIRKRKLSMEDENVIMISLPFTMLVGLLFAFLWDCFFRETWRTWNVSGGVRVIGFTYFGWLFGALMFLIVYGAKSRLGAQFFLNLYLPLFALAQAIGRIGCFLGGCCYGMPCSFLGVSYPPGSLPYSIVGDMKLFPVQLLESICLFALFIVCMKCRFSIRASSYLIGVALLRFGLEWLRFDNRGSLTAMSFFTPAQAFSILFLSIGIILFLIDRVELMYEKKCQESF